MFSKAGKEPGFLVIGKKLAGGQTEALLPGVDMGRSNETFVNLSYVILLSCQEKMILSKPLIPVNPTRVHSSGPRGEMKAKLFAPRNHAQFSTAAVRLQKFLPGSIHSLAKNCLEINKKIFRKFAIFGYITRN